MLGRGCLRRVGRVGRFEGFGRLRVWDSMRMCILMKLGRALDERVARGWRRLIARGCRRGVRRYLCRIRAEREFALCGRRECEPFLGLV